MAEIDEDTIEPTDSLVREIAAAPPVALEAAIWPPGTVVDGAFCLEGQLGAGGMGVVYAARDLKLEREVAVKVMRRAASLPEAFEREARATARLNHRNVVTLHQFGRWSDRVYLVLERLRGETLHARLARGRPPPGEALAIFEQIVAALVHTHAAGVLHRDLKPHNVFLLEDGTVKVLDFGVSGLVLGAATADGSRAGTPGYMAPEQWRGEPQDERTDVWAAGAILYQLIAGALPFGRGEPTGRAPSIAARLPRGARGLGPVVARCLALGREDRVATAGELLAAVQAARAGLDEGRRRGRRRAVIAAAGAAVAAALGGAAIARRSQAGGAEPAPCSGGDRIIAASWDRPARAAQLAGLAARSAYGRELAPRLAEQLAGYEARWAAGHRDACIAHRRGLQSGALLDRRMACLERGRAALSTLAELAMAAGALPDLARAAAALPEPDACADLVALAGDRPPGSPRVVELRGDLERARVQLAAGRSGAARTIAHAAGAELRALAERPLLAEALLVEGHALIAAQDPGARALLAEATTVAIAGSADELAIEAWARRAWWEGTTGQPEAALAGLDVIEALAARTPAARFARALLHNNVGSVQLARGRRAEARAAFERAWEVGRSVSGPGAVELVTIRRNLALVIDDRGAADAHLAAVVADLARLLGPHHPDTLLTHHMRATITLGKLADAAALLDETCRGYELHEALAAELPACLGELGDVRSELGDVPGARAAFERALARGGGDDERELRGYLALWAGDAPGAAAGFAAALAELPAAAGEPWYQTYARAKLWLGLGRALGAAGTPAAAQGPLDQSERALAAIAREHPAVAIERRLGRARAELAGLTTGSPR